MKRLGTGLLLIPTMMLGLAGCSRQDPQEVREKTAQATQEIKSNAKAVADGVKEGWNRDKALDLNTASREQLAQLPGVSAAEADKIVAARPFDNRDELVSRGILTKPQFDAIADRVMVKK